MKRIASFLVATMFATISVQAEWTITSTSGSTRVITDGNWTLNLYNNYNGGDSVAYSSNAGNSTELDLTGVYADTGRTITRIDNQGFKDKKDITKIILPDSCKVMWNNAFQGCTALETVGIPSTFTTFNSGNMFDGCSALKTIYFTDETPEIGTVHLPEAITDIKGLMFSGCSSIEKVIAPGAISIGDRAFQNCSSLTTVEISPSLATMTSSQNFRGCSALTTIYPAGSTPVVGTVMLPDSLTAIPSWGAFYQCTSIEHFIARGVTDVYNRVFYGCTSLVSVEFSPNLAYLRTNNTSSDQSPFYNCTAMTTFSPAVWGPITIGAGTFRNCTSLTTYLDLSNSGITEIPSMWAAYTALDGVTFPAGLTAFTGDQNLRQLQKGAKFRFLGDRPTVTTTADKSPFYTAGKNNESQRHVFVVDAKTYPAWTNGTDFVAMADIASNSDTKGAFLTTSADFPATKYPDEIAAEEVLGATIWGSGNGRYNWVVQYVDHSKFDVTWRNGTETFGATRVEKGFAPEAPAGTPEKASTDEFDYTFLGWNTDASATVALDLSAVAISADTTFYAIYSAATRSYTITWEWDNGTGTTTDTTTVAYGGTPVHAAPTKAGDGSHTYSFSGWSTDGATVLAVLPAVTGAATYIAVFQQHDATTTATVSWFDEDGTTALDPAQTTVTKGDRPAHAEPTKAPTVDTVFTFAGWVEVGSDGSVTNTTASLPAVTADIAYKAAYTASVRRYTVTFANWDGTVVDATDYDYGTAAADVAIPADPTRPATAEYTYAFDGWDAEIADVLGAATYTATYTETANEYVATFVDGVDGSTIEGPTTYAYGAAVTAPEPPGHYGFTFSAWSPAVSTMPAAATTYTAVYTTNRYTITWVNGDATTTAKYDYLTPVTAITVPTGAKKSTAKASYTFLEWSPALEPVQSNTTYTAMFQGTILSSMTLLYGGTTIGEGAASAAVSATMSNYTAGEEGFSAGVTAALRNHTQVFDSATGTAAFEAPAVTATFTALSAAKGYDWTIVATQWLVTANVADVATLHGRFYAKPTKTWFTPEQAVFTDGAFKPVTPSGSSQQVRIRATMTFPAVPSRAPADATGAVTGIDVFQANAGKPRAYYAWNGAKWVQLHGATAKLGEPVNLLGVIDFAIRGGTMTWYADGAQLTDADGNWAIPMSLGPKQISRFVFDSETATLDSLSGDYDLGFNGTLMLIN